MSLLAEKTEEHRLVRVTLLVAVAVLSSALLCGCAQTPDPQPADEPPSSAAPVNPGGVQPDPAAQAVPSVIEAMSPDDKRATIAPDFPIEVPVPSGEMGPAKGQGGDAWDYEVVVVASPEALARWYAEAYASRQWLQVGESGFATDDGTGVALVFRKARAESEVRVQAGPDNTAVARVILGVGAPVLETQ